MTVVFRGPLLKGSTLVWERERRQQVQARGTVSCCAMQSLSMNLCLWYWDAFEELKVSYVNKYGVAAREITTSCHYEATLLFAKHAYHGILC